MKLSTQVPIKVISDDDNLALSKNKKWSFLIVRMWNGNFLSITKFIIHLFLFTLWVNANDFSSTETPPKPPKANENSIPSYEEDEWSCFFIIVSSSSESNWRSPIFTGIDETTTARVKKLSLPIFNEKKGHTGPTKVSIQDVARVRSF